jgi:hypothetical protein
MDSGAAFIIPENLFLIIRTWQSAEVDDSANPVATGRNHKPLRGILKHY